ncbi:patj homolog isoform X1 [Anopheles arabiensis]|uniref:Multiple PDZ domain protein n=1 Tax=Anopheles arabiensis TaxID=7173 RepID=A0A182I2H3_ANOAR|nr:patj homolog isoform X1 [Anopheles arabiensis]
MQTAKMHLSSDVSNALKHIEIIKQTVEEMEPNKLQLNVSDDLKLVLDLLQDPVFRNIVQIQDSLAELNHQITQHPSILPGDFDIANGGELVLSVPPGTDLFEADYQDEQRVPSAQISPGSPPGPAGMLAVVTQPKLNLLDQQQLVAGAGPAIVATVPQHHLQQQQQQPLDAQQLLNASMKLNNEPSLFEVPSIVQDHHHKLLPDQTDQHPLAATGPFTDSPKSVPETIVAGTGPADWSRILDIELVNDGTGLGFGIIGARTTGVTVKTILAGGVADRDGRLKSGDQILQIGDVNLHEMVSEQVASVLRQSGTHVQLVVARPIDPATVGTDEYDHSAIVPTVLLANPLKLKQYLSDSGFGDIYSVYSIANLDSPGLENPFRQESPLPDFPETEVFTVELRKDQNGLGITIAGYVCEKEELSGIFVKSVSPGSAADLSGKIQVNDRIIEVDGQSLHGFSNHQAVDVLKQSGHVVTLCLERYLRGPKYDQLQQAIAANEMKPPTPATPPPPLVPTDLSKYGSNILDILPPQALQRTLGLEQEQTVGEPDDQIAECDVAGLDGGPLHMGGHKKLSRAKDSIDTQEYRDKIKEATIVPDGAVAEDGTLLDATNPVAIARHHQLRSSLKGTATVEETTDSPDPDTAYIVKKWTNILGPEVQIIVANIRKFAASSGLGISLEGTVDVEGGKEVRPHHYIRSILPEGPVGQNGLLRSGDELLEVNGQRLLGMNHLKVVSILKELPQDVCMVCARGDPDLLRFTEEQLISSLEADVAAKRNTQHHHQQLHGSLTPSERLVKAKSDGSLATTNGTGMGGGAGGVGVGDGFSKIKSRSLEPLTGLAMWSSEPQIIELIKGERGLGFSILDYQDPLDPNDTLIVIRSLVPGGVAQLDGRLIPGDRLLFVNDTILENASLDQAVQALKGAPKGVVRIGVAKPLPMQDSSLVAAPATFEERGGVAEGNGSGKMLSLPKPDIIME